MKVESKSFDLDCIGVMEIEEFLVPVDTVDYCVCGIRCWSSGDPLSVSGYYSCQRLTLCYQPL